MLESFVTGTEYYCDGNNVNRFCPEYDLFEGNKYAMLGTLHKCEKVPPHHYINCDRTGCGTHAYGINPKMMCPDTSCIINTNKPYRAHHTHNMVFQLNTCQYLL